VSALFLSLPQPTSAVVASREIIAAAKTFFSFIFIPPFTDIPQKLLLSFLQRAFIVTDECKIQSKLAVKSVLKRLQK
jgi:hypothetical protein